jgi:hypothetical protein
MDSDTVLSIFYAQYITAPCIVFVASYAAALNLDEVI